ncbi:DMT family transporter [Kitasatospora sp. NPDC059722]|uniref:DMT family transporter n=1 Tax=Kitasatospora sp. NPDC059722 TaxID=3346925 RepID=UPI0036B595B3
MPNRTRTRTPSRPAPATPAAPTAPGRLRGPLPILAAAVLWGTTGTASSLAPAGAPPAVLGAAALVLGGLLLFLSSRDARALPGACTRGERRLLALGAVAVVGYPLTFYPAVTRTGVAVSTVIALGSAPVFTGLLGWIAGRQLPGTRWAVATAAAVLGCAVLVLGPGLTGAGAPVDLLGVLLAALSGLSYAAYSLIGGALIARGHASGGVMGAMFGAAAVLVLPVLVFGGGPWLVSLRGAAVVLHLAVITTFLAYRLFGHGLRRTTAQTATTLTLAEPAVAALLGVAVLGERLPAVSWSGLGILAAGLALLAFG